MPQDLSVPQKIVMIGSPLDHVRSPDLINAMLQSAGIGATVITCEITAHELDGFVAAARGDPTIAGLIVTTPLKQSICAYLQKKTPLVSMISAANCVRCDDEGWVGANFDGFGFINALRQHSQFKQECTVLLLGCGGAGTAIAASMMSCVGVKLCLYGTNSGRAASLSAKLSAFARRADIKVLRSPDVAADIVINASPIGMSDEDASSVPDAVLDHAVIVADIVVRPDTRLKQEARRRGKMLVDGEQMVQGQAEFLWRFVLGKAAREEDVLDATAL
ncbi:shikimate dehydrogenase [soil metagenome]